MKTQHHDLAVRSAKPRRVLINDAPVSLRSSAEGFSGLYNAERAAHAEIAHRAYSIWECKGRRDDSQLEDWLEAEAEVRDETAR